ncbi:hypothetical protein [Streptomyces sp. NPDC048473]|uniref:hypothetical protein n=1 Tax=unclassified Streptomyces TaxID=2593676 RepID=UPI003719F90D
MDLSRPLFALDPFAADAQAEAERLLEAGPVVPVDVIGVPVWAVSHHAVAQRIFEDPSFSMNSSNIALPAFFDRFDAVLAVPMDEIEPVASLALNGVRALPAIVRPRQKAVAGG